MNIMISIIQSLLNFMVLSSQPYHPPSRTISLSCWLTSMIVRESKGTVVSHAPSYAQRRDRAVPLIRETLTDPLIIGFSTTKLIKF